MLNFILNNLSEGKELSFSDIAFLLSTEKEEDLKLLFQKAYEQKLSVSGKKAYVRGLIEYSNICTRDCYYCGIRKSNKTYDRYSLSFNEIMSLAEFSYRNNYSSIVIQSGERSDQKFIDEITKILKEIQKLSKNSIRVTLSLGEQTEETYKKWQDAGAHRYLLRIETSNKELYSTIHPESYSFENRVECLAILKKLGYQLGTGVLIGFPGQTVEDLANDVIFMKNIDADMIGMGPYIPHKATPMGKNISCSFDKEKALQLGLKMIAVTRLHLKDVNIASTTALETLNSRGLEKGLLAGANVFMINLNDVKFKKSYFLYDNKPCFDCNVADFQENINKRLEKIGEKVAYGIYGDSKHYKTGIQ